MTDSEMQSDLEALVEHARRAPAPPLSSLTARRMVRTALHRRRKPRRTSLYVGVAAAAVLLISVLGSALRQDTGLTSVVVAADARPLRLSLKTGDGLVLAPDSRLVVLSEDRHACRVRVERGEVLFDIARLGPSRVFEVFTAAAHVRVRGTVFSVEAHGDKSVVRVYEGAVSVNQVMLHPGDSWASRGRAGPPPQGFVPEIRAALAARNVERPARRDPATSEASDLAASAPTVSASRSSADNPAIKAPPSLERLRALLRAGEAAQVLSLLAGLDELDAPRALLRADALRLTGLFEAARSAYLRVADGASGSRDQAGFAAAQLSLRELSDPEEALRILDALALDRPQSSLRERASALRIETLVELGRLREAELELDRYLAREPATAARLRLEKLVWRAR